ncbi:MAG: type II toxin-antitoxin system RelE/ParE family toxin [Desulfobacterales bacterium]
MKIKDVLVLKDAVTDPDEGKSFYDSKERGVGDYFWDTLISDMESLTVYAGIHSKKYGFYRMFSKRFPYAVYSEIRNEIAYIIAVLPIRRNPSWIKRKMEERG